MVFISHGSNGHHSLAPTTPHSHLFPFSLAKAGKRSRNKSSEWCRTGIPRRVRYCLGMLAFILEPVPPANRTKPTSDRSVSADGKDSSPPAASDVEEDVALCEAKVDVAVDGRDETPPNECVNAFDDGKTARTAAAASVVAAQILILNLLV